MGISPDDLAKIKRSIIKEVESIGGNKADAAPPKGWANIGPVWSNSTMPAKIDQVIKKLQGLKKQI